jgi:hypothetical protein
MAVLMYRTSIIEAKDLYPYTCSNTLPKCNNAA